MKLVHHPNIIRMETVYESRQHIFIVMELHSGGELFDRIVGRPRFSENEAFSVIYPLVESVAYLHEMGIVHRDLKVSACSATRCWRWCCCCRTLLSQSWHHSSKSSSIYHTVRA
jgi:serine/threonine protein kinase